MAIPTQTDAVRTLLIVEDDPALNQQYHLFCQLAIGTQVEPGLQAAWQVKTAFTYEEALACLNAGPVDFVSVDLALQAKEIGLGDKDRTVGNEPGGMRLLKHIQKLGIHPLVVVVSGETLLSYARDALQRYGVLAYFQKGQPNFEEDYLHTVQAALSFLQAQALIGQLEAYQAAPEIIQRAALHWDMAKEHSNLANLGEWSFPDNLETRISALKSRLYPGSNLPGDEWTREYLRRRILRSDQWMLVQVYLRNFDTFAAGQASQVAPLLSYVSGLIQQQGEKLGCPPVFTGAWRHEDLLGPCLLALFPACEAARAAQIEHAVQAEFTGSAGKFVHGWQLNPEIRDPALLPHLALRSWRGADQPFSDWPEFVDKLSMPAKA